MAREQRRLAAILAADVVGYSRLMERDESGTLARLQRHRAAAIDPGIADHRGRIVKSTGDGVLVEFASVVDAVRCAVEIQRTMADREAAIAEDQRIRLRIGINIGDIIVAGDDIFGDGVNVAARLEGLAEPGGICVSTIVRDQVRDKLGFVFEDMGEQTVKNIARPVGIHRMSAAAVESTPPVEPRAGIAPAARANRVRLAIVAMGVVAMIGVAAAVGLVPPGGESPPVAAQAPAGPQRPSPGAAVAARPSPRLSIVVLPFTNASKDPDQDYLADALTDDLTTDISRIADSFVIARSTAFTYKGKVVDARQIGRELGVRYILEGSVRRSGEQVGVNVQLIDAETGAHLWADRFETNRKNLAEAQSEITGRLAQTLHLQLVSDIGRRVELERAVDPDSRDFAMRGWALLYQPYSPANRQEALQAFERSLAIDPRSIEAMIGIASILASGVIDGLSRSVDVDEKRAEQLLRRALELDANRSMAHATMGLLRAAQDRQAEAQAELEMAIALDPNNAFAIRFLGRTLMFSGQPAAAIPYIEKALRLNPRDGLANIYANLGKCQLFLGHTEEALALFRKAQAANPKLWFVHLKLAGTLGLLGRLDEARAEFAEMEKLNPAMSSVARVRSFAWYSNPQYQRYHDGTIIRGLRLAGFRES